jgi:predicted metalloendopeptidase
MRTLRFLLIFTSIFAVLATTASLAQSSSSAKPGPGFSVDDIDKAVDPCVDFYQYACGNWIKHSEIPPDQSRWVSFVDLHERNLDIAHTILEKAAAPRSKRDAIDQKIGDFYSSCMDETAVNRAGITPLKPELDRIEAAGDKQALIDEIAHAHMIGAGALFNFSSGSDLHNADHVIAYIDQGGLTMPDRDYYLKDDDKTKDVRKSFVEYVNAVFTLADSQGGNKASSSQAADTVLRIETALAKAEMDRTTRRDPKTRDHKMSREDAAALGPDFHLDRYFQDVNAPSFSSLNVSNPEFFKQVNAVLQSESLESLKTYVRWHVLNSAAPWLSQPFVEANFKYQQALNGQKEIQARWKRCVNLPDRELGEALGQKYVAVAFPPESKARMLKMVQALEKSLGEDIQNLTWMSDETKKAAAVKLAAIRNKIGYPDKWRDYSSVEIRPDDYLGDVERAVAFESHRDLAKIGKPVDRKEWGMSPPTVNAYYDSQMNDINFPAGVLQPPLFDPKMDDAPNYGGIGLVIGHELTHGFDDQGRKFDPQGNLSDWWTKQDGEEFEKRASCIADEYSNFVSVDDLKLNGRLTLGENTADNGGARVSLMALQHVIADDKTGKESRKIDGFTPEQRFFLGFGRVWCELRRPEVARVAVRTDSHSPGKYRVDGVVQNMPEFEKAWSCKAGQPMVAENACHVW